MYDNKNPCLQRHLDQPSSSDHYYKQCDCPETTDSASCKHFIHLRSLCCHSLILRVQYCSFARPFAFIFTLPSFFPTSSISFCSIILPSLVSSPFLVSLSHSLFPLPPPYTMSKVRQSEPGSQNCQHCSR